MKSPIDQFNAVFKSEKQNICSDRYNYLIEGKTYCFTSAGWWRKWCDFVNIECKSYFQIKDENLHQSHIDFAKCTGDEDGELDSRFSDVQWVEEDIKQQQPKQLKFIEDDNFYSRPGKIINKGLISYMGMCDTPRQVGRSSTADFQMQDMYDYVKIDEKCWNYFKKWYDYDFEIKVKNHQCKENTYSSEESSSC